MAVISGTGGAASRSIDELVARAEADGDRQEQAEFYREFDHHVLHVKGQHSDRYVIKAPVYELALRALKSDQGQGASGEGDSDINARFKHWVCESFRIEPGLTASGQPVDQLYCKKRNLPIVPYEKLYAVIRGCHVVTGHHGRDKTWSEVSNNFAWVPYKAIRLFLGMCSVCKSRNPALKRPLPPAVRSPRPPRAIAPVAKRLSIPVGFMMRLQVDFLDLSALHDGDQRYIALVRDTFSEYSWAQAASNKDVNRVARMLYDIFIMFGPCRVLQSAEGDDFVRDLIARLLLMWDGLFIIVGRCHRHQQAALLYGSGNSDFVAKLQKWMEANGSGWTEGLPRIVHAVNTSPSTRIGVSPYEVVFDQRPHATYQGLDSMHTMHEEDLSADMLQFLAQAHDGRVSKKAARKTQNALGNSDSRGNGGASVATTTGNGEDAASDAAADNYFLMYKGMRVAKVLKRERPVGEATGGVASDEEDDNELLDDQSESQSDDDDDDEDGL